MEKGMSGGIGRAAKLEMRGQREAGTESKGRTETVEGRGNWARKRFP